MVGIRFSKLLLAHLFKREGREAMSGEELLAYWWTLQWKRTTVMYPARGAGYMPITKVFNVTAEGEAKLDALIERRQWRPMSNDDKAYAIMRYISALLKYINDINNFGKVEFWADPFTIWLLKQDDCDGFAVLIAYLCWHAGIPRFRLKVVGGYVEPQANGNNRGHAYCLYLKEADNKWYTIEGSFYSWEARTRFREGIPHSQAKRYEGFWWTTTDEQSWSQKDLVLTKGVVP